MFLIHSLFGWYQIFFFNTTYYDLGILFNQLKNYDQIYQKISFRPINYFFYYLNIFIKDKILYFFILLNSFAIILPLIFFLKFKKINFEFLFYYISLPITYFATKNFFHSDILLIYFVILNLYSIDKNKFFFVFSLIGIFLIKDIFFYIHIIFFIFDLIIKNEKLLLIKDKTNNLKIFIFYFFLFLLIFLLTKNIPLIIYFSIIFLYIFITVNFLIKKNKHIIYFFGVILFLMSLFNNEQIFSIKNHNNLIFFSYILYFIFKDFSKINKTKFKLFAILNLIILIFIGGFESQNKISYKELLVINKKIENINKEGNKLIINNSFNFYPLTNYYKVLNIKNLEELNSDLNNVFVIINKENFYIDDKKCNFRLDECYKNRFENDALKPTLILEKIYFPKNYTYFENKKLKIIGYK